MGLTGVLNRKLVSLQIPATVRRIILVKYCPSLKTIIVDEENPRYTSINGVLFEKTTESLKLIMYPSARKGTEYTIPENVISVEQKAFWDCAYLETIDLNHVEILKKYSINGGRYLTEIRIPEETEIIEDEAISGCDILKNIY